MHRPVDPGSGEADRGVAASQDQGGGPKGQGASVELPVLQHPEAHEQPQKKDGDPVEKVGGVPVALVGEDLAYRQPRQNSQGGQPFPVGRTAQPAKAEGRDGIEGHGSGHIPVEGPGGAHPVVEQGAVPQQGRPVLALGQDEVQGVGEHDQVVGGQDPGGAPGHKGGVVLFPAGQGHGKSHGGQQDEDVHSAKTRRPDAVEQRMAQVQVEGVEQHDPQHSRAHQLRAVFA